jgi:hypothetical protein
MRHVDVDEVRRILEETVLPEPPAEWTGAWVAERMIEAFRILDRLPERLYPRAYRASAAFLSGPDFADAVAAEATRDRRAFSWGPVRPSAAEISRMEAAFDWPRRYSAGDTMAGGCLFAWAHARARNRFPHWFLKRHALTKRGFHEMRLRACYAIAVGLARDGIAVD